MRQFMNYTLIIQCAPSSASAVSALKFAQALISAQHSILRVFFYGEGVLLASTNTSQPQDEWDVNAQWRELITTQKLDAVVCIATALKRGILDAQEAERYNLAAVTSAPFELSGLGQLVDACAQSDRVITFA